MILSKREPTISVDFLVNFSQLVTSGDGSGGSAARRPAAPVPETQAAAGGAGSRPALADSESPSAGFPRFARLRLRLRLS
eukprot:2091867-Rhodomonas_salina.3